MLMGRTGKKSKVSVPRVFFLRNRLKPATVSLKV